AAPNPPIVGWLVAIDGPDMGRDFKLFADKNYIKRAQYGNVTTRDILLNDETVSRNNHAVVAFYAATEQFFCAGGDARELFSLNNEPVLETRILKKGDILTVGKTKLMFVPFCGEMYHWGMNKD
ncbi:MAG: FHA domain-containing protein, partial [Lachnospiraceae bacterium]|nr:FHA domain-containing protein [Lachnospiraceae bacterium]